MATTIKQIAARAQVSHGAVSAVLSGRQSTIRVAEETRERIRQIAREMGYRPNSLARGLRGGATQSIGLIWGFYNPYTGDGVIANQLIDSAQSRGLMAYQAVCSREVDITCRQVDEFAGRRVDALVIQADAQQLRDPRLRDKLALVPAYVAVSPEPVEGLTGDLVVHDRGSVIDEVVDHLVKSGRRRLAMALSVKDEPRNLPKWERFKARCAAHGLRDGACRLIELTAPVGYETHGQRHALAMESTFAGGVDVDAIFCFNDIGAMYVGRFLKERGLRVPEDVALVGCNDSEAGRLAEPPLASGDRRRDDVYAAADRLLRTRLEQPGLAPRRVHVPMRFVWRASAGGEPPHAGAEPPPDQATSLEGDAG